MNVVLESAPLRNPDFDDGFVAWSDDLRKRAV
jgi:hypothetical protein